MRFTACLALFLSLLPTHLASANIDVQKLALQRSYLQAIDCRTPQQLVEALKQSLKDADNLTARGHHASVLEEVMMHNPACFVQALNTLPKRTCQRFVADYLEETFFYPRDAINASLSATKQYENSCLAG